MNRLDWTVFLLYVAGLTAPSAGVADAPSRWTVRAGYAYANFDTRSELSLAGAPAPGAAVSVDDEGILMGDVGFDINEHWTARVAIGAPLELPVLAAGTLLGLTPPLTGTLGEIEIAPIAVSLLYTPRTFGGFSPYVGAAPPIRTFSTPAREMSPRSRQGGLQLRTRSTPVGLRRCAQDLLRDDRDRRRAGARRRTGPGGRDAGPADLQRRDRLQVLEPAL